MDVLLNNDVETVDFGETAMRVKLTREVIEVKEINDIGSVRILMLKGEKGDVGYPTDEQVYEAVDTWLTAHPEATTTVQDNSLTWVKFNDVLKDMMFKLGITDSKSGEVVSTSDAAEFPLKDLQSEITATQNLNGYDYPWVGGAGTNRVDNKHFTHGLPSTSIGASQNTIISSTRYAYYGFSINGGNYTVSSVSNDLDYYNAVLIYGYKNNVLTIYTTGTVNGHDTIDLGDCDYMRVCIGARLSSFVVPTDLTNYGTLKAEEGTTATPWENICPISGRTEVNVTRTGKNLVEDALVGYNIIANGTFEQTSSFTMQIARVKQGVQYTKTAGDDYFVGGFFTEKPTPSSVSYNNSRIVERTDTFTAPIDGYVVFRTASSFTTPQLELGSTATAYEPYEGETFNTELGRTVYGGTLDLTTGVLTVNTGIIASYNGETIGEPWISDRDRYVAGTSPTTGAQVVYTKASETYQLDRTEVDAYFKNNTIWSDSGDVAITYLVDAKTYIDNH